MDDVDQLFSDPDSPNPELSYNELKNREPYVEDKEQLRLVNVQFALVDHIQKMVRVNFVAGEYPCNHECYLAAEDFCNDFNVNLRLKRARMYFVPGLWKEIPDFALWKKLHNNWKLGILEEILDPDDNGFLILEIKERHKFL